jgi:glyoxylase-like metal-dependent hydrolase (beta-lactamase superfamily II)
MRKLRANVFLETRYPGVALGAVASEDGLLLVDAPLRGDDGREWLAQLGSVGRPRYLALLDHHPDRALGARGLDLPVVAQEATLREMRGWPDAFKGGARPIGAEADRLKRITGVGRAVPELGFSEELRLQIGRREVLLQHRPGPTPGAMWVVLPEAEIAFIGDTVTVSEPPYLGEAQLEDWMDQLETLRSAAFRSFLLIAGRDGLIEREHLNDMARFLRRVQHRLQRPRAGRSPAEAAARAAGEFMRGLRLPPTRRDLVRLRLQAGLTALFRRTGPGGN